VNPRPRKALIAGGVLLVLAGAYVLGLVAFTTQRDNGSKAFQIDSGPNGIGVDARVIGVDPDTDAMTVRLEFAPLGDYAASSVALSKPVDLFISTAKGRSETHYARGAVMSPTEATVALNGGAPLDYPFDKYDAALLVYAERPKGAGRIPVSMRVTTGFNGFKIDTSRRTFIGQGYPRFKLRRASTTIFFAVFIMVVFWATALAALWLATLLAERRRKFETASVAFLAALLFAFPTVRNNLPGNPPIGSLNDFLAFFWTEGIVALALVAILITYCLRLLPGAKPPDE
jgi:Domain of unknown function (DUF4436)